MSIPVLLHSLIFRIRVRIFLVSGLFLWVSAASAQQKLEMEERVREQEVPLGGQRVDPGEWYWKLQGEFLMAKVESDFQPEWRAVSLFGYEISERNKLEMGLDYRSHSFHRPDASSQIWLNVNWFVRI